MPSCSDDAREIIEQMQTFRDKTDWAAFCQEVEDYYRLLADPKEYTIEDLENFCKQDIGYALRE